MRLIIFIFFQICTISSTSATEVKNIFVGTWTLETIESLDESGDWIATDIGYGIKPLGYLMYDPHGNMSVQLMRRNRPHFGSENINEVTLDEFKTYCGKQLLIPCIGHGGYFGTYDVDEKESSITHHRIGHHNPNSVETDAKRFYKFIGNKLILMPTKKTRAIWNRQR